jgi:hypothetical protein
MSDGTVTAIAGELRDPDGWLRVVTIDWGDGTLVSLDPLTLEGGPCPMAGGDFPNGSMLHLSGHNSSHQYAAGAPRIITVTGVSTSCDGVSDRQTGVGRVILSAPLVP